MDSIKKYKGKHLLSFLRNGDFTHVGEEEAVQLVMQKFPQDTTQLILDAGCGLGGTANFVQTNSWGKVIGVDIEPASIEYAKIHYPKVNFYICDITYIDKLFTIALFDIVYLFNVYHSLYYPRQVLQALQKITKQGGHIAIFDHLDLCNNQLNPLFQEGDNKTKPFHPIKKTEIANLLTMAGWVDQEIIDLSDKYMGWHQKLFDKLKTNEEEIIQRFGQPEYLQYYYTYSDIFDALQKGLLGGAVIYATRK